MPSSNPESEREAGQNTMEAKSRPHAKLAVKQRSALSSQPRHNTNANCNLELEKQTPISPMALNSPTLSHVGGLADTELDFTSNLKAVASQRPLKNQHVSFDRLHR